MVEGAGGSVTGGNVGAGPVIGEDTRLVAARRACDGRGTDVTKLEAMRELVAIDSSASRQALETYAAGSNARLAVAAITTIPMTKRLTSRTSISCEVIFLKVDMTTTSCRK